MTTVRGRRTIIRRSAPSGRSAYAPRKTRIRHPKYSPFSPEGLGLDVDSLVIPRHPPTPPNDDIDGTTITGDAVKEWPKDYRDRWRTNEPAYVQWSLLEESHERHRSKPLKCPALEQLPGGSYGFFLLNSHMGSGKNMIGTYYGALKYAFGWPVASTAATKFGKHIGPKELYHFGQVSPFGMFILCDEIHTVFHASSSGSNRENAFQDHATAMRKREITFMGMSASKRVVSSYKSITDWVGYIHPLPYDPRRQGNGWEQTWRFTNWWGPKPYDKDDYEVEIGWANSTHIDKPWQEIYDSDLLLEACKLFNSWTDVEAMWGADYMADDERSDRKVLNGQDPEDGQDGRDTRTPMASAEGALAWKVVDYYSKGMFQEQEMASQMPQSGGRINPQQLVDVGTVVSRINEETGGNHSISAMKRALGLRNVHVSTRGKVDVREIAKMYQRYCEAAGLSEDDFDED